MWKLTWSKMFLLLRLQARALFKLRTGVGSKTSCGVAPGITALKTKPLARYYWRIYFCEALFKEGQHSRWWYLMDMISGWKKLMLLEKSISFLFPRILLIKSSKYQGAEVEGWWQGKDGAQSLQQTISTCSETRRSGGDEVFSRGRQRGGFGIACLIHFMIHPFRHGDLDAWIKRGPSIPLYTSPPGRTCWSGTEQCQILFIIHTLAMIII